MCRLEQKEVFLNDPFRKFIEADSKYVPFSELWISRDWPDGCETGKWTVRHVPPCLGAMNLNPHTSPHPCPQGFMESEAHTF